MVVLIGPCMFLAPLVVLLLPVAAVLWPPVLLLVGLAWLLLWPFASFCARRGWPWLPARHRTLRRWFVTLLKPWNYFDAPPPGAPKA